MFNAPIKLTDLTSEQRRKWSETRSAILWKCPAFTHILFSMLNPTRGELAAVFTTEVDIAATDGSNLILNPNTFFEFAIDERVFIVAHEILHCIFNHCILSAQYRRRGEVRYPDGDVLPYDSMVMNMAMDYVINDTLINDKLGVMPKVGLHDPSIATSKDNFVEAYRKVYNKLPKQGQGQGGGREGSGTGQGQGFDKLLEPGAAAGKDPISTEQERSQAAWDTAVAAAIASAKLQGKLPAGLERLLGQVLEPEVSWQEHIRGFFARRVGGSGYNWRKVDKRMIQRDIFSPRRAGNGCGPVVVAVDTSGSIGQRELDHFFAEMRGILDDVQPSLLHVVWCDAKVHKVDEVEDSDEIDTLKPLGGGGTDFRPVFSWIEENSITPDALVYLTDMLGSFPDTAPNYPVIWGDIYGRCKAPFGDVVSVPIGKK